ncbi:epoxide hydrolase 2-like isoform X2 [Tasmannia lanceolata]|uniref:epoxide hydrolase 2-like isoform X2 n=1 Tax=Tasmannia lanceolata TaxID=3420 RepID=UPI00406299C1
MEEIQHTHLDIRGLKLHVAEIGKGPIVVVFLHGFPEIWYSWRYQMMAVANAGFRAIAFDFRGYGLSQEPPEPEKASFMDLVHDLLAILDSLAIPKEPRRAEADFERFDVRTVVRNVYILFSRSEIPVAGKDQEIMDLVDPSIPLPHWFTDEDLTAYATLYEKSGFRFPLQVPYRAWMGAPSITDPKVQVPALLVMGEKDYVLKFLGMEDYIRSGKVKDYVPDLEIVFLPEGSHFVQEQLPDQVNQLIITFLNKHT